MFGDKKIKLDKNLLERAEVFAAKAGYASVEEFIVHILGREIAKSGSEDDESEEEVKERLKGLGYIS